MGAVVNSVKSTRKSRFLLAGFDIFWKWFPSLLDNNWKVICVDKKMSYIKTIFPFCSCFWFSNI